MTVSELEIIKDIGPSKTDIRAVLFDFDGTISTLRRGWEGIMEPLMIEFISGDEEPPVWLQEEVREYIDHSTGIQTIYQMKWLAEKAAEYGLNPVVLDPWNYKEEYNRRLLKQVDKRLDQLAGGELETEDFMIEGSRQFLERLKQLGYELFLVSGTDHPDVVHEADILSVKQYFKRIAGAPVGRIDSSKRAVIDKLVQDRGLEGRQLLIIGDGKVEIGMGVDYGTYTLGMATDEVKRMGINQWKRERLIKAGAHAICGDFRNYQQILSWLRM